MLVAQHGRLNSFHVRDCQGWHKGLDGMRGPARLSQVAIDCLAVVVSGLGFRLLVRAAIMRDRRCRGLLIGARLRRPRARRRAKRERGTEQKSEPKSAH